jgi:hypothetical protein
MLGAESIAMPYVIKRQSDHWYVSKADLNPTGGSYTKFLQYAAVYGTIEAAERDKCGNEYIVPVDRELRRA